MHEFNDQPSAGPGDASHERRTRRGPDGAFAVNGSHDGGRALFVLTSHETLGPEPPAGQAPNQIPAREGRQPTGFDLLQAATTWRQLREVGIEVDFASPRGGAAPIDPASLGNGAGDCRQLLGDAAASHDLRNTLAIERACASDYTCVCFVGGHGALWDFPDDPHIIRIAADVHQRGGAVAAIAEGVAALLNVRTAEGMHLLEGLEISAPDEKEERAFAGRLPYSLTGRLRERGARLASTPSATDQRVVTAAATTSVATFADRLARTLEGQVFLRA